MGTIQFVAAVQGLKLDLESEVIEDTKPERLLIADSVQSSSTMIPAQREKAVFEVTVPQVKPLSPGEILGCTAPRLAADTDALM